jgi:hypothetical protein
VSQRYSGYQRVANDHYATPAWVTDALLPHIRPQIVISDNWARPDSLAAVERFKLAIWEPACGEGKMTAVLDGAGHWTVGTDIEQGVDFLVQQHTPLGSIRAIITNPPYNLATEFIEHALTLMRPVRGIVAMLLRADFDHARTRGHLFARHPAFARRIALTRRIRWFEDSKGNPSFNHSWFLWDWENSAPPTIAYAPAEQAS